MYDPPAVPFTIHNGALVHTAVGLAAAGALTCPVCPVCEKTHVFGRFPQFRGVPEKSGRRKSPLSNLFDPPQGLLWPETGRVSP